MRIVLCAEGADVLRTCAAAGADGSFAPDAFRYESYVQAIMGEVFSLGFGPFRWVCASGRADDLRTTDRLAAHTIRRLLTSSSSTSICYSTTFCISTSAFRLFSNVDRSVNYSYNKQNAIAVPRALNS